MQVYPFNHITRLFYAAPLAQLKEDNRSTHASSMLKPATSGNLVRSRAPVLLLTR